MTTDTAMGARASLASTTIFPRLDDGDEAAAPFVPQPLTLDETGLEFSMVLDLVVKAIYFAGRPAARQEPKRTWTARPWPSSSFSRA